MSKKRKCKTQGCNNFVAINRKYCQPCVDIYTFIDAQNFQNKLEKDGFKGNSIY